MCMTHKLTDLNITYSSKERRVFSRSCWSVCGILKSPVTGFVVCVCPATASPNSQANKSFLCGAETQLLDLKVHITAAEGHSLVRGHALKLTHGVSFSLLLADNTVNSPCCDWLVWLLTLRGVDGRKTKGTLGRGKRYPLAVGATVLCSAVYHLTLHNWVHTSTKWRSSWRPTDREGRVYQRERWRMLPVTCAVLSPSFFSCLPSTFPLSSS